MSIRIGQGYDVHIFGDQNDEGNHIALGGLRIASKRSVVAHSDGDVILHALCDAIYGALAAGDIGHFFPPSDDQWRNTPSILFLEHANGLLEQSDYQISNIDITVIAEMPKIGPHRQAMCDNIANILGISSDQVSIKATTHERIGSIGRGEGLAALATILIEKD